MADSGVYRFQHLSAGFLVGQDGWVNQAYTPNQSVEVFESGAGNLAVRHSGNVGQAVYRFNDVNYTFPTLSSAETNATMFADFRVRFQEGQYNALVGLAADSTDPGTAVSSSSEISPYFGLIKSTSTAGRLALVIRGAGEGTTYFEPVVGYADDGDWIRLKFIMDFVSGEGSLFCRNITRRGSVYEPVPNCTRVDLELARMNPDCPPAAWNAIFMRMTSDLAPQTAREACAIDNIIPHLTGGLPVEVAAIAPPAWMKITVDRLALGEQYLLRSAPLDSEDWVGELLFLATAEIMVLELRIDPDTFAARKFQAIYIP